MTNEQQSKLSPTVSHKDIKGYLQKEEQELQRKEYSRAKATEISLRSISEPGLFKATNEQAWTDRDEHKQHSESNPKQHAGR